MHEYPSSEEGDVVMQEFGAPWMATNGDGGGHDQLPAVAAFLYP